MYVKVSNGVIEKYPYTTQNLRNDNPNTSFPLVIDNETLALFGVAPVTAQAQPFVDHTQRVVEGQPELVDGVWTQQWVIEDLSEEELARVNEAKAAEVRRSRNDKLAACDWTQLADAQVDKASWANYRQALRDLTTQEGFPWSVGFPEQPE